MQHTAFKRSVSAVLAAAVGVLAVPVISYAEDGVYTRITTEGEFTSGKYVIATDANWAMTALDGSWIGAQEIAPEEGIVTLSDEAIVWDVTVSGDTVTLTDSNEVSVAPAGGNNNGIASGEYSWTYEVTENGAFIFGGEGGDTVYLASNRSQDNKFRAYKTTTVTGNPSGYPHELYVYKLSDGSGDTEGGDTETVAMPQADPASGTAVELGTTAVTLTADADADIYYSVSTAEGEPEDPTAETGALYSEPFTITADMVYDTNSVAVKAIAVKDGVSSNMLTLRYTVSDGGQPSEDPGETEFAAEVTELETGDNVAIYMPSNGLIITDTASGSRLAGAEAVVEEGSGLAVTADTVSFTVRKDGDGNLAFISADGRYLTSGETGNSLTLASAESAYSLWTLEEAENGYYIRNVNAAYSGRPQYIEYYSGFTTYSLSASNPDIYTFRFYKTGETELPDYTVDTSLVLPVGQWAGNADYSGIADNTIYGDVVETNDMQDTAAAYTAVVNGERVAPYTSSTPSTGGTTYYMGSRGIGSGSDDHLQFALSSAGYGSMDISFRLRVSNTGPGDFTLMYSTDGTEFENFTTGEYSYAYTSYAGGEPHEVAEEGEITDGIAETSMAPGEYITFSFDIPQAAENADMLYIRLVPGGTRASGDGTPSNQGTTRIDSVVITGSPVSEESRTGYVSVTPDDSEDQPVGTELTMINADDDAVIYYRFGTEGEFTAYDEAAKPVLASLPAVLQVYAEAEGKARSITRTFVYQAGTVAAVEMDPNGGGVYIQDGETAQITLSCDTEGAVIYYAAGDGGYTEYTEPITLNKGFGSMTVSAYAVKDGYTDSAVTTRTFTERLSETYNLYFGQLHSHTAYSDGAGSCEDAFAHAKGLDDSQNIDFLAVTDHSNSFDNADSATITDGSMSEEWTEGHELADEYTDETFVGIYGYEMTWSNGLGHINTFNTDGFQSRTQSDYTTYSTALQNYYETLKTVNDSLSQFNHPGTTFGDFQDFAHYDEEIDEVINLIEVGNGEGAIGSSGYFPSYEYYTRALDKGWHLAPSNNQDNHKGNWGDSNTGRTVVLADTLDREAIYDAIRNYRVYATEDENLEIQYKLNGSDMGSILSLGGDDEINISASLNDIDDEGSATVQVIVNGGKILAEQTADNSTGDISFVFDTNDYSYYYLRVNQADGQIAVTAPVWTGEVESVGITGFTNDTELSVAGEEQNFTLELYNNENSDLEVESVTFTDQNGTVLEENSDITSVSALGTATCTFAHTFDTDGIYTVTATVRGSLDGVEKTYNQSLELTVMPAGLVSRIVVDGTHYNDYVTGYYGGNMGNMTSIAAEDGVKVDVVTDEITDETLDGCGLLVISAPAKRTGTANAGDYTPSEFSEEFIATVKRYVDNGGSVIVCGLADYQDSRDGSDHQTSVQLNKLMEAIGSTMRFNDDEVYDTVNNGGQAYRLYPSVFNTESGWTNGVVTPESVAEGETYQTYSQYSGCSVDPGEGTWLVKGFDTTCSVDSDRDGTGISDDDLTDGDYTYDIVTPAGDVVFLAAEDTAAGGTVFAAGGVFLSDFEVKAELDNIWDLPYANRTIFENIMAETRTPEDITDISEVRKADTGRIFAVEGYVTAGTENANTSFFDAIYVQDETGGITVFPYSESGLEIGTKLRITGYTDEYQGDKEIQIISVEELDEEPHIYEPLALSTADATDYDTYGGRLISVTGTVSGIVSENGTVSQFNVTDSSGTAATVFIDGYITNEDGVNNIGTWLTEGSEVSAAGLLYRHPEGSSDVSVPVLRVRNCDEITQVSQPDDEIELVYENGTVRLTGGTEDAAGAALVKAAYADGILSGITFYEITDPSAPVEVGTEFESGDVKLMLWDGTGTMKPLADALTSTAAQ